MITSTCRTRRINIRMLNASTIPSLGKTQPGNAPNGPYSAQLLMKLLFAEKLPRLSSKSDSPSSVQRYPVKIAAIARKGSASTDVSDADPRKKRVLNCITPCLTDVPHSLLAIRKWDVFPRVLRDMDVKIVPLHQLKSWSIRRCEFRCHG